jgi:predicted YcjX-like family ATPase
MSVARKAKKATVETVGDAVGSVVGGISDIFAKEVSIGIAGFAESGKTSLITAIFHDLIKFDPNEPGAFNQNYQVKDYDNVKSKASDKGHPAGRVEGGDFKLEEHLERVFDKRAFPRTTEDKSKASIRVINNLSGKVYYIFNTFDYPGVWLADIAIIGKSYREWSEKTLADMKEGERKNFSGDFLNFISAVDPNKLPETVNIGEGAALYTKYLEDCLKAGLTNVTPGRFLKKGSAKSEILQFFPLPFVEAKVEKTGFKDRIFTKPTIYKLFEDRFSDYIKFIKNDFYKPCILNQDNLVILVDSVRMFSYGYERYNEMINTMAAIVLQIGSDRRDFKHIAFVCPKVDHINVENNIEKMRQLLSRLSKIIDAKVCFPSCQPFAISAIKCFYPHPKGNDVLRFHKQDASYGTVIPEMPEHFDKDVFNKKLSDYEYFGDAMPCDDRKYQGFSSINLHMLLDYLDD